MVLLGTGTIYCKGQNDQGTWFQYLVMHQVFLSVSFCHFQTIAYRSIDLLVINSVEGKLKKLRTSKGNYWIKQWFSSIASLFKMGTSLKGKNLLPWGANSFLYDQFFMVWKITFITLRNRPWVLLFLLCTCVTVWCELRLCSSYGELLNWLLNNPTASAVRN